MSDATEKIRELLEPYLAQVQAIAETRPDLNVGTIVADARLTSMAGLSFSPVIFFGEDSLVMAHGAPTIDDALDILAERLSEIPAPPTRAELIAKKRAELADLEGGES